MRIVVDMNLTPDWIDVLAAHGHDAVHWSSIGREDAPDDEILVWARANDRIILTSDLDFGTMMAMSGEAKPGIVQLRSETTLPFRAGPSVVQAIDRSRDALLAGALLTIEAGRLRLRALGSDHAS